MSRQIVVNKTPLQPQGLQQATAGQPEDQFTTIVLKLIPADAVAAYSCVFAAVKEVNGSYDQILQLIVFGLAIIATIVWLKYTGVTSTKQVILTIISFIVWVLSIGGPIDDFKLYGYSLQFIGSLILPFYAFAAAAYYKKSQEN